MAQFRAGHYKEAIALYKKLLQQGDNDDWYRQLARCYLERAKSFAARGMIKEALALWESHTLHAQPPYRNYDQYLLWLILSGDRPKIETALRQLNAHQLDKEYPMLSAILGLLALTRHPEWRTLLPVDSAFMAHLATVSDALQADDLQSAEEALQHLPYRSAMRDLRLLLKACQKISDTPDEFQLSLNKIPSHSPYAAVAKLLGVCSERGAKLAEAMSRLDSQQRHLIADIIGLSDSQRQLIDALSLQQGDLTIKAKFRLAVQFQSLFGAESAKRFCLALLNDYPLGQKEFRKNFGAIDEFEHNRIKALLSEEQHRYEAAESHWRRCIKLLRKKDTGNPLQIALILRHMAGNRSEPEQAVQLLEESLEYDPTDKEALVQITTFYGGQSSSDRYRHWLQRSETLFPRDVELLTLAAKVANRDRDYRKTVHYAHAILQIDPMNSFAKQTLVSGHLNQARQYLTSKQYRRAENELEHAELLKRGKDQKLQTQLLRALLIYADGDKTRGLQLLKQTLEKRHHDPLNMQFQAAMEALLCGLPVATLLRALPATTADFRLSKTELSRLIEQLAEYGAEQGRQGLINKALERIKAPLKKSLTELGEEDQLLLSLCRTLYALEHHELMRHCIKSVKKSLKEPLWSFYQVYAETSGDPGRCTFSQVGALKSNLELAVSNKDRQARLLLEDYLDRYHETRRTPETDRLLDQIQQYIREQPVEKLFDHVPDEVMAKIDKKLETLLKKTSPERLVQDLLATGGGTSRFLLAVMNDPALFTALMTLKAADELGVDLQIGVEDVLNFFDANQTSPDSLPFPF